MGRRLAAVAGILALGVLVLGACGDDGGPSTATPTAEATSVEASTEITRQSIPDGNFDQAQAQEAQWQAQRHFQARQHFDEGMTYLGSLEVRKAIEEFTAAMVTDTQSTDAQEMRGMAHSMRGEFEEAVYDFTEVLSRDPEDAEAYHMRASAYGNLHILRYLDHYYPYLVNIYLALADINSAIELDPYNACYHNVRGSVLAIMGDYQRSFDDFSTAIELNPRFSDAYLIRSVVASRLGRYGSSEIDRSRAEGLGLPTEFFGMIFTPCLIRARSREVGDLVMPRNGAERAPGINQSSDAKPSHQEGKLWRTRTSAHAPGRTPV
jgi:tetratricopeptide (TPR) repeat protein